MTFPFNFDRVSLNCLSSGELLRRERFVEGFQSNQDFAARATFPAFSRFQKKLLVYPEGFHSREDVVSMLKKLLFPISLLLVVAFLIGACAEKGSEPDKKTLDTQKIINRIAKESNDLKGGPAVLADAAEVLSSEAQKLRGEAEERFQQTIDLRERASMLEQKAGSLREESETMRLKLSAIKGSASTLGQIYQPAEGAAPQVSQKGNTTTILVIIILLVIVLIVYFAIRRRRLEREEEERLAAIRRQQAVYTPAAPEAEEKKEPEKEEQEPEPETDKDKEA